MLRVLAGTCALAVSAGGAHTCALLNGGKVACWGNNAEGQLGLETSVLGALLPTVVNLNAGVLEPQSFSFGHMFTI